MEVQILQSKHILGLVFLGGAIFLAYHGKEGWGWCIFGALCCI